MLIKVDSERCGRDCRRLPPGERCRRGPDPTPAYAALGHSAFTFLDGWGNRRVPAGMAVRVQIRAGLGDTQVPSGYTRQGDSYVSPGYDTAANRVDLDINGSVGRVAVEESAAR